MDTLNLELEWLDAPGVLDPALACSWSRFALFANGSTVTQCSDEKAAGAVRVSIYGSLLPLAEWALTYWYHLLDGRREAPNYPSLQRSWRLRHAWRAGRDGQAFPNLMTHRQGSEVAFTWHRDEKPMLGTTVQFLQDGELRLTRDQAESVLSEQLMTVLSRRLDDLRDPRAEAFCQAWRAHLAEPTNRRQLRQLIGRLDLEEDQLSPTMRSLIVRLANKSLDPVVDAVIDAADPDCLAEDTKWAAAIWRECEQSPPWPQAMRSFLAKVESLKEAPKSRRWEVGWKRAQAVRELAPNLKPNGHVPAEALSGFMKNLLDEPGADLQRIHPSRDRAIDDVVAWAPDRRPTFVMARDRSEAAKNFRLARDLHAVLFEGEPGQSFARVASNYLSKSLAEANAFATELLAPVSLIEKKLGSEKWISHKTVEQIAEELAVQPQIVSHQIENHQLGTVYN
jgi:hypothetical protein